MATNTYRCDTCKRDAEILERTSGLDTLSRCIITSGCRGRLYRVERNPNNVRETLPPPVPGLVDYFPRKKLVTKNQSFPSNRWRFVHDLNTIPAIFIYVDDRKLSESEYSIDLLDRTTVEVSFPSAVSGTIQLISRSSADSSTPFVQNNVQTYPVSANGILTFAIPKFITQNASPPPSPPIDLATAQIEIEVFVKLPNEEEVACFETLINGSLNPAWAGWNLILVRKRKNYYVRSKKFGDFKALTAFVLNRNEIPAGTEIRFGRIDYGFGQKVQIPPRGLMILLSTAPHSQVDKIKNKIIDVSELADSGSPLVYMGGGFTVDTKFVEETYPEIQR